MVVARGWKEETDSVQCAQSFSFARSKSSRDLLYDKMNILHATERTLKNGHSGKFSASDFYHNIFKGAEVLSSTKACRREVEKSNLCRTMEICILSSDPECQGQRQSKMKPSGSCYTSSSNCFRSS